MGNSAIDTNRHDRIHIYVDSELYDRLAARCADDETIDDLVEKIVGCEDGWLAARDQIQNRAPVVSSLDIDDLPRASPAPLPKRPKITCACCPTGCQCPWAWRRTVRCGCTPERLAFLRTHGDYLK